MKEILMYFIIGAFMFFILKFAQLSKKLILPMVDSIVPFVLT